MTGYPTIDWLAKAMSIGVVMMFLSDFINKTPRLSAFVMSLPLVTLGTFIVAWYRTGELAPITMAARDMLVWIPVSLLLIIPFALVDRFQWGFWSALWIGLGSTVSAIVFCLWLGISR